MEAADQSFEAEVRAALRQLGASPRIVEEGAAGLISGWRKFVESVERGYKFGLDDYRNELDLRTLIAAVGLASQVASEDRRLRALLVNTRQPLWESDAPDAFWVCGYPGNAGDELMSDLRASGLAPSGRCAR
jgi:hypothetical protein